MSDRRSTMRSLELFVVLLLLSAHPIFSLIRRPSNSSAPHDCAAASVACERDVVCSLLLRSLLSVCGANEGTTFFLLFSVLCFARRTLIRRRRLSGCREVRSPLIALLLVFDADAHGGTLVSSVFGCACVPSRGRGRGKKKHSSRTTGVVPLPGALHKVNFLGSVARCAAPAADVDKCVSIVRTLQSSRHLSGCSCPGRHVRQLVQHPAPVGHSPYQRQQCARIRALVFRHPCLRSTESRRETEATATGAARTPDAGGAQQPYEQVSLRLLLRPDFLAAPQPPTQTQDTSLSQSNDNPPHNGPPEPTPLSDTPSNSVPLCSQVRLKCLRDSSCEEELNIFSTQCRLKSCLHSTFTGYTLNQSKFT